MSTEKKEKKEKKAPAKKTAAEEKPKKAAKTGKNAPVEVATPVEAEASVKPEKPARKRGPRKAADGEKPARKRGSGSRRGERAKRGEEEEEKKPRPRLKDMGLESILDLNANNVWNLNEEQIAALWEMEREEEGFSSMEEKLLNTIRLSFEVVHYNPQDEREVRKYENGEWSTFARLDSRKGIVAIRRKYIKRITDLSYENVRHITAAMLLELIDRNFGGGWDSIPLSIKDIIESGFDISTTQLPTSRIHMPGGTLERKVAQGFEVLEVEKGTWTEAIFAKKKEPLMKLRCNSDMNYDEDGNIIRREREDEDYDDEPDTDEEAEDDDTFYSSYAAEAEVKEETEEGFPIED